MEYSKSCVKRYNMYTELFWRVVLKTLCKEKKKSFSFYIDNILIKTSSI